MRQSRMPGSISEQNRFLSGLSGRYLSGSNDDLQWMQRRQPDRPHRRQRNPGKDRQTGQRKDQCHPRRCLSSPGWKA